MAVSPNPTGQVEVLSDPQHPQAVQPTPSGQVEVLILANVQPVPTGQVEVLPQN